MQTCLLCSRIIKQTLTFSEFFLLKNKRNLICNKCQSLFKKIPNERCPRCSKSNSKGICADCLRWEEKGIIVNHQAIFIYNQEMKDYFSLYKFMGDYRLHEVFDSYFKNLSK
jgi:competence protein ComFC